MKVFVTGGTGFIGGRFLAAEHGMIGDLTGANRSMDESVSIGVYPGLTRAMLDQMIETILCFIKNKSA